MVQTSPTNSPQTPQPPKPADSALPTKELSYLEELIGFEKLLVNKYKAYGEVATDANLKSVYERAELMHHHHRDILVGCLTAADTPAPSAEGISS